MARRLLSTADGVLVKTPSARRAARRRSTAIFVVLAIALAGGVAGQLSARDQGAAHLTPLSYVPQ